MRRVRLFGYRELIGAFIFSLLTVVSSLVCAGISPDSTILKLKEKPQESIESGRGAMSHIDSVEFTDKIVEAYNRLEVFNNANENEGKADENLYVIAPTALDLENDVWMKVLSGQSQSNLLARPGLKAINERLKEFNNSRKDNLRLYVILCFEFKAYLKSNITPPTGEYKFEADMKRALDEYFNGTEMSKVLNFTYRTMPGAINEVNRAMVEKGYYNRIIYSFASLNYYTPDNIVHGYKCQSLAIESVPDTVMDKKGKKSEIPSRLTKLSKEIGAKGKQKITSYKGDVDYVRQVVENIATAVEIIYDRKENISDKGVVNCGKPLDKSQMDDAGYKEAVELTAAYAGATTGSNSGNETVDYTLRSDFIKIDDPKKFNELGGYFLPDKAFVVERLPDILNLLPGRSDYTVYVTFAEIGFVIPREERLRYAKDVYEHSAYNGDAKVILFVVPYYSCPDDYENLGGIKRKKLMLMPAAYTPNDDMNLKMNAPLLREGEGFRSGFEQAFKYVPKDHTYYMNYTLWNGQHIFKNFTEKRITGHSNFVDILVFVDDRIDKIKKYLKCQDEYHRRLLSIDPYAKQSSDAAKADDPKVIYTSYLKCLSENGEAIRKILLQQPEPKFQMLPAALCNLKQSKLMGDDAMFLSLSFAKASVRKTGIKFWTDEGGGTFEKELMDDDDFYEKKNPFREKHFIFKLIDVGSILTSFIGLDFIFDMTGVVIASALGDQAGVAEYTASILIPAVLAKGIKELRIINSVSREAYEVSVISGGFFVRSGDKMVITEVGGITNLVATNNDGADLLRTMGVADEEVLAAARADASLGRAMEESLVIKNNDKVVAKPEVPGYGIDHVRERLNDPDVIARYKAARANDANLDFISFLKKTDRSSTLNLSQQASIVQAEDGWFTLVVDQVDASGKVSILENGILKELDITTIGNEMKKTGYVEGRPIRVVSLNQMNGTNLAEGLAEKFGARAKHNGDNVVVDNMGVIKTAGRSDNFVHWLEIDLSPGAMFPKGKDRTFVFIPRTINPNGSIVFMLDGKPVTYTTDQIAGLLEKNGLRADETIEIGLPRNGFYQENYDNLPELAERLSERLNTHLQYPDPAARIYYDTKLNGYNLLETPKGIPMAKADMEWVPVGEKKPLILGTRANYLIAEKDSKLYVVVESFSPDGKVVFSSPVGGWSTRELTPSQFLEEIERVYGKEALSNKAVRIVPTAGTVDEVAARRFLGEAAQKSQKQVEMSKEAVKVADGSTLQVKNLNWLNHHPVPPGRFFLQQKLTTDQLNALDKKLREYSDEFADEFEEAFGKSLSQNGGKYVEDFKKNFDDWTTALIPDYNKYKFVEVGRFVNIQSISKRLKMELPESLVKDLYGNPGFADNLNKQLKSVDASDIKKLTDDQGLFNEALDFVKKESLNDGKGLPYFMAHKNLQKKLPDDVFTSISGRFSDDEMFFVFLSKEIDELSEKTLAKFKLYQENLEFLDELLDLHKINPGKRVDLSAYTIQYQEKHQMLLVGTSDNLRGTADAILPRKEFQDIFLRADGDGNFLIDGDIVLPEEIAAMITKNPHWDDRPLRLVIAGKKIKSSAQPLIDKLRIDARINVEGPLDVVNGRLVNNKWDDLIPGSQKATYIPDADMLWLAENLKYDEDFFYVFIHGNKEGFMVVMPGFEARVKEHEIADWLIKQTDLVAALRKGKNIMLMSCESAANGSAMSLSQRFQVLAERTNSPIAGLSITIRAPDVKYGASKTEIDGMTGRYMEGSTQPNGKFHEYRDGKYLGQIKKNADIRQLRGDATQAGTRAEWQPTRDVWIFTEGVTQRVGSGHLDKDGIIGMSIDVKIGLNDAPVAEGNVVFKKIFNEIEEKFGADRVKGIRGSWLDDPKLKDNLETFNKKILEYVSNGMEKRSAAYKAVWDTFTGKMALEFGFTEIEEIVGFQRPDGTYPEAKVLFRRK